MWIDKKRNCVRCCTLLQKNCRWYTEGERTKRNISILLIFRMKISWWSVLAELLFFHLFNYWTEPRCEFRRIQRHRIFFRSFFSTFNLFSVFDTGLPNTMSSIINSFFIWFFFVTKKVNNSLDFTVMIGVALQRF